MKIGIRMVACVAIACGLTACAGRTSPLLPPSYRFIGQVGGGYYVVMDPITLGDDGFKGPVKKVLTDVIATIHDPSYTVLVFDDMAIARSFEQAQSGEGPDVAIDTGSRHMVAAVSGPIPGDGGIRWFPMASDLTPEVGPYVGIEVWSP